MISSVFWAPDGSSEILMRKNLKLLTLSTADPTIKTGAWSPSPSESQRLVYWFCGRKQEVVVAVPVNRVFFPSPILCFLHNTSINIDTLTVESGEC